MEGRGALTLPAIILYPFGRALFFAVLIKVAGANGSLHRNQNTLSLF